MPRFNLQQHLADEHRVAPFSKYLREIVYGGNDGIVTTFAIVAGFAGAQKDPASSTIPFVSVLLFGLANLFSDGLSMSLGSFLSIRADQDVYKNAQAKELHEITHQPHNEYEETLEILRQKGFNQADAKIMASLYQKNPSYWTEFMMNDELQMPNPEHEKPASVALFTFIAFVGFGTIPLLPYIFRMSETQLFPFSIIFTGFALLLLALLRAVVTQRHVVRSIVETLLIGGASASVAYLVGTFFRI